MDLLNFIKLSPCC